MAGPAKECLYDAMAHATLTRSTFNREATIAGSVTIAGCATIAGSTTIAGSANIAGRLF